MGVILMDEDMKWMKMKWMKRNMKDSLFLSISFSLFGMLLIFGLGFVFPTINPYVVIKWIIIVCAVVFAYSFVSFLVVNFMMMRMKMMMKDSWKEEVKAKKASKK
jgi:hypothetical protein